MKLSFVIGVLNEVHRLPRVIESIRSQEYPPEAIEVVVADGGSSDGTVEFARENGCVVIANPLRRCEPGIALGYAAASGDVVTIMAADNVLHSKFFARNIVKPFDERNVCVAVPRLVSTPDDCLSTHYLNDFTDPFNHFVYSSSASPLGFHRAYPLKHKTEDYVVYDFGRGRMPLIAMAQGVTLRSRLVRRAGTEEDDVMPILDLISQGFDIAYVPEATVEHHTVKNLSDLAAKFGPRIAARLDRSDQPIWHRADRWTLGMRVRAYLWPFYSVSLLPPAIAALAGAMRDRRASWLFHPLINLRLGIEFWKRLGLHVVSKLAGKT